METHKHYENKLKVEQCSLLRQRQVFRLNRKLQKNTRNPHALTVTCALETQH